LAFSRASRFPQSIGCLPVAILGFRDQRDHRHDLLFAGPDRLPHERASFRFKIGCILLGAIPVLYFTLFDDPLASPAATATRSILTKGLPENQRPSHSCLARLSYGRLIYISN